MNELRAVRPAATKPFRGWLRAVREAVGISQAEIASKLAVKRQSYAQFETAEETESISVASLRRAAAAMGCDLVYFLVPAGDTGASFTTLADRHDPRTAHRLASDHSAILGADSRPDATR